MKTFATELFTLDEVNRIKIIQYVVGPRLITQMAAHLLGISDRQCRRLRSRYREHGPLLWLTVVEENPAITINSMQVFLGTRST